MRSVDTIDGAPHQRTFGEQPGVYGHARPLPEGDEPPSRGCPFGLTGRAARAGGWRDIFHGTRASSPRRGPREAANSIIAIMTTPIRTVPDSVARWISRMWCLRWVDAAVAWIGLWGGLSLVLGSELASHAAVLSLTFLCLGLLIRPIRSSWRPISGWVGLAVSRGLRPGDRAWYVRSRDADLVLVTARHGARLVIVSPDLAHNEGLHVRRTRVLLIPAEVRELSSK